MTRIQTLKGFQDFLPNRSPKTPKTHLYIDGTNLLAGLVELFGYDHVPNFPSILKEIKKYFRVDKVYFYASYTPAKNIRSQKIRQQIGLEIKFFKEARQFKNLVFYQGSRSPSSKKEKGVDVHLAVDFVKDAFQGKYKRAVIFTGDADLTYAVRVVRGLGLSTFSVFLPNRFSRGIFFESNSSIVLNYKDSFSAPDIQGKMTYKLRVVKIKTPAQKARVRLKR